MRGLQSNVTGEHQEAYLSNVVKANQPVQNESTLPKDLKESVNVNEEGARHNVDQRIQWI